MANRSEIPDLSDCEEDGENNSMPSIRVCKSDKAFLPNQVFLTDSEDEDLPNIYGFGSAPSFAAKEAIFFHQGN